ncbi:hypothetical protein [Chryseobacterium daeguense]|uniref:hypothetical protein n=1 Tax=Chryseobacterium daeguense TaxID=412438 RepID=UPI0003F670D5|nr:hypothetical protein [Chryseobacterium daeguense]
MNNESIESKLTDLQQQIKLMQHLYFTINLRREEEIPIMELLKEIKTENEEFMSKLTELKNTFLSVTQSTVETKEKHTKINNVDLV